MDPAPELEARIWGDAAILRELEDARQAFESGDRSALIVAVFICARFQAVIPEWAVDALLDVEEKLESGHLQDANEAFGWEKEDPRTRAKRYRQNKKANAVLTLLLKKRLAGENLNRDEMFGSIAAELGIPRRDVEAIYRREGQFIRDIPRGGDGNIRGFYRPTLSMPRRRGRPIFRDPEG